MTDERAAVDLKQWEYQWTFLGRRYRAVETEPGIISYFATAIDSANAPFERIESPLGLTNELVHMAISQDALRAENERLKAENASLKEANEIDLGEKAPLIFENTELSARVSELTRLLAEAEEGVRKLYEWAYAQEWETEEEQVVGEVTREMATDAGEPGMVGMPLYGNVKATWVLAESGEPWCSLRDDNEFVQRALQSGEGGKR